MIKRYILFYGALCGIMLTLYVNMTNWLIYNTSWGASLGYLAILILPLSVFMALREIRKKEGAILLRHTFSVSLFVAFLAATVYSAYSFIDIHFFNAGHLDNLFEYTEREMAAAGKSKEEILQRLEKMHTHYHSSKPYISTYIWYLGMGLIYAILFYFLFKLKRKPVNT